MTKSFLQSTVLEAIAFMPNKRNAKNGTLRIWFKSSKRVWDYHDVPRWKVNFLVSVSGCVERELDLSSLSNELRSVGRFYNYAIKGQYHSIRRYGYRYYGRKANKTIGVGN